MVGSFLPWLPIFIAWVVSFYVHHQWNWVEALYPVDHWTYPFMALAGFIYPAWNTPGWVNGLVWALVAGCLLTVATLIRRRPNGAVGVPLGRRFTFLGFTLAIPLVLVVLLNAGVPRYVVYLGPFTGLLLAAALVTLDHRLGRRALLAPIMLLLVSAWNLWYQIYPSNVGWWSRVDPSAAEAFWVGQPLR